MLNSVHKKSVCEDRFIRRSPLRHLNTGTISESAKAETRNREIHVPPVSVYRWWARRTEAINGAIIDALASDMEHNKRLLVVDPFAGGGIIPLSAVIRQDRTYAQDINPWAIKGVAGMFSLGAVTDLRASADRLAALARPFLEKAYATSYSDGAKAKISHTFRVASAVCPNCKKRVRLFPFALVSLKVRRERGEDGAFLACPFGHLFTGRIHGIQSCPICGAKTDPKKAYTPRRVVLCPHCGALSKLEKLTQTGWKWECVLVERVSHGRRELGFPTKAELLQAEIGWRPEAGLPDIPEGQETRVLRRHGFRNWADLYPARQRVIIETLLSLAASASDDKAVVRALRLAIIGSTEMAGYLSRWDRFYLKSYEAMAGHRFNFTTFTTEPNVWGTHESGRGSVSRRIRSFEKATDWFISRKANHLNIEIRDACSDAVEPMTEAIDVRIVGGSSERLLLPDATADIVLTDPPYHDDVQYHELSLPFRAWAELSIEASESEALVNTATGHNVGKEEYANLLLRIFSEIRRVLRPDGHLIFSYANRELEAWRSVFRSLDQSGFRAAGYTILHSENETDVSKRNVKACLLDLLMDLVPANNLPVEQWRPESPPDTEEGRLLNVIGNTFLKVGELSTSDMSALKLALETSSFLNLDKQPKSPNALQSADE